MQIIKNKLLIGIFVCVCSFSVTAQQTNANSIVGKWKAADESKKMQVVLIFLQQVAVLERGYKYG